MPNSNNTVAIVCGGPSAEADVSRLSASRLSLVLEKNYDTVLLLELDPQLPAQLVKNKVDIVFPIAHGSMGEDGALQGLLDIMEIPYIGSNVLGSACSLDKTVAKHILQAAGVPLAKDIVIYNHESLDDAAKRCINYLGSNVVIKPLNQGSGIGVQFADGITNLRDKLSNSLALDQKILVEEFISGREITAGVLDCEETVVLPVTEITTPDGAWYDYAHRYTPGLSEHTIPALLPEAQYRKVQEIALKAHQLLGCRDLSRSDFIVPGTGSPVFIELNNLPGMTPTSLFPDGAKAHGILFEDLVCRLVDHALRRGKQQKENKSISYWPLPKL
ncbi:MAG: D-alanine--D-alanine ligase [Candidatus Endonucleobacter sp. (ex Gigantidas childressi)]|nr:D-alanine--D-alanine ligase [Candidatus Endonucleobacter sp. (ex Gigantidas childressi)]